VVVVEDDGVEGDVVELAAFELEPIETNPIVSAATDNIPTDTTTGRLVSSRRVLLTAFGFEVCGEHESSSDMNFLNGCVFPVTIEWL
jgi:hypothetical protein